MAVGIYFYQTQKCIELIDSLETHEFTLKMNDMFDDTNKTFSTEGIRKNSRLGGLNICCMLAVSSL